MSYGELGRLVRRFTNVLRSLGVGKGERVFTIMGRIPELYISDARRAAQRLRGVAAVLSLRAGAPRHTDQYRRGQRRW